MEFPNLGKNCGLPSCSQLDFLPFTCDMCQKIFCKDHQAYEDHDCSQAHLKDVRVPVCPLCNSPVPVRRGEDPNYKVNEHINQQCKQKEKKKAYTNVCNAAGCKQKELMPVRCNSCGLNFCLSHRFEQDHKCVGRRAKLVDAAQRRNQATSVNRPATSVASASNFPAKQKTPSRLPQQSLLNQSGRELNQARIERQQKQPHSGANSQPSQHSGANSQPSQPSVGSLSQSQSSRGHYQQTGLSEDEALARALQASLADTPSASQEPPAPRRRPVSKKVTGDEDEDLQRAIAASLQEQEKEKPSQDRCTIS